MQEIVFFYETTIDVFSSLFYHLIFLVIYVLFSYLNSSDSNTNYYKAISENIDYSLGTNVIEVLTWGVL